MRKISAALTATALAALALVGCAPAPGTATSFGCAPSAQPGAVLKNVQVTGKLGAEPTVDMPKRINIPAPERKEAIVGEGRQITASNQVVDLEITILSGTSGKTMVATSYKPGTGAQLVNNLYQGIPSLGKYTMCAREGSRLELAIPAKDVDPQLLMADQIAESSGVIAVIDVIRVARDKAEGSDVFNTAWGLPAVVRTPSGAPGLVIPDGKAPKEITVQTLIQGDGKKLSGKEPVLLNVLGVGWNTKTPFYNTWATQSPAVQPGQTGLLPGFGKALAGATIGSQLLIVVPQDKIAPDADQSDSHPTDTPLVYVVDVIGTQADLH